MQTIAVKDVSAIEIISAYAAASQPSPSTAVTPGWYVVGAFFMPVTSESVRLTMIGSVSEGGLTMRARLFDVSDDEPVGGTTVEIGSTVDARRELRGVRADGGRVYQIQIEVIGAAGFGSLKEASLD